MKTIEEIEAYYGLLMPQLARLLKVSKNDLFYYLVDFKPMPETVAKKLAVLKDLVKEQKLKNGLEKECIVDEIVVITGMFEKLILDAYFRKIKVEAQISDSEKEDIRREQIKLMVKFYEKLPGAIPESKKQREKILILGLQVERWNLQNHINFDSQLKSELLKVTFYHDLLVEAFRKFKIEKAIT